MLSKSCEYAIRSVLCIASNQKSNPELRIGLKQLAVTLDIPVHFLGKVMQLLTRHGILNSFKGRNGGFFLTEEQQNNSLISIVEIMDGLQRFEHCALGLPSCSSERPCALHNDFAPVRDGFALALKTHTIASLVESYQNGEISLGSVLPNQDE
jgi:Rrf2 family iron-sulfur cluster assembly transcriptional regulator